MKTAQIVYRRSDSRMCVMPVNKLVAFETLFDRATVGFLLTLGLAAAGAVAMIGA